MRPLPEAAGAIARAAYVFLYPLVVNYGAAYEMAGDPSSRFHFGRRRYWRVTGPTTGRSRPVVEQMWSTWLDLGAEPVVLITPAPGQGVWATQWFDLWGFAPELTAVREQRRAMGAPILFSANQGEAACPGTEAEVRSETRLVHVRCTQNLRTPSSHRRVTDVAEEPVVMPLSAYLGLDAPRPRPTPWWEWHEGVLTGPDFWDCAAFALSLTTPHPEDVAILGLLREIGVVAGCSRSAEAFEEGVNWAIDIGMYQAIEELVRNAAWTREREVLRTRRQIDRNYFDRAVHALARPRPGHTRRGLSWAFTNR